MLKVILALVIFTITITANTKQSAIDLNDENTPAPTTNNNIWKYRYQELDINGNINQKGFVTFKIQNDNERGFLEVASYDSSGPLSSNKFEEKNKLFLSNVLYDVTNPQSRRTFLQFSPYLNNALDLNINFSNKTPITNFPVFSFHNDYSWTLTSEIIGSEQILYKGKSTNAIKVILNGQRPTGQGHCMQGQPGKIYIESWYVKDSKRYARQVVKEYNCSSIGNTLLTEETYELIQ